MSDVRDLLANLADAGIVLPEREFAEALWLAVQMRGGPGSVPHSASGRPRDGGARGALSPPAPEDDGPGKGATGAETGVPLFHETAQAGAATAGAMLPVRLAAPRELARSLDLQRALRPLKQTFPSPARSDLDEQATAEQSADAGSLIPCFTPGAERWLSLALVIDTSPSMVLWQDLITEFQSLLAQTGVFRAIRSYRLRHDGTSATVEPLHRGSGRRSPRELIDPSGRQATLILSDCVDADWQSASLLTAVSEWARSGPLAIVQPLSQDLWSRSALNCDHVQLRAPGPGVPNHLLSASWSDQLFTDDLPRGIPVPVLELEPDWLASWARLVGGITDRAHLMVAFTEPPSSAAARSANTRDTAARRGETDPRRIVEQFMAGASPAAFQLAGYLAAAPLSLPMMRHIQHAMFTRPRPLELAEVYLGGLMRLAAHAGPGALYEFLPGVRDVLLDTIRRSEALKVSELVSAELSKSYGTGGSGFSAFIPADPNDHDEPQAAGFEPYSAIQARVLSRIGGSYARPAVGTATLRNASVGTDFSPPGSQRPGTMMVIQMAIGPGDAPGRFQVEVVDSPAGSRAVTLVRLDAESLTARRRLLQQAVLASSASTRSVPSQDERTVREVGQELFTALLGTGEVAGLYRASAAVAAERGEGLRVVLRIDDPALTSLPWEAMFDPETKEYLCRRYQLIRQVPTASAAAPLQVRPPLRILGVTASPRDFPQLDMEREKDRLVRALAQAISQGLAEVHWVSDATWAGLQYVLMDGEWDVLHFIGHGNSDPAQDEGVLALTRDEDGRADLVPAHRLVELLRQARPMPRLVVLNSCAGPAAALVRGGVPAVTSMQYEISDAAAIAFARGFYSALARGLSVGDAVASGRIAILSLSDRTLEWVTPVLYLNGHDTRLSTLPAAAADETRPRLRSQREAAGLSLRALGKLSHFSASYLSRIETGLRPATPEVIRLYAALGPPEAESSPVSLPLEREVPSRLEAAWFGSEVRRLRIAAGKTQAELGTEIHLSGSQLGKIERGVAGVSYEHAQALDTALDAHGRLIALFLEYAHGAVAPDTGTLPSDAPDPAEHSALIPTEAEEQPPAPSRNHLIFISYRRSEQNWATELLYAHMTEAFGTDAVFKAGNSIRAGEEFPPILRSEAASCPVMLACIGPGWLTAIVPDSGRRLDSPDDWVREEIAISLQAGNHLVPLLIGNHNEVEVPKPDLLPESIRAMVDRQALRLAPDRGLDASVLMLVDRLAELVPELAERRGIRSAAHSERTRDSGVKPAPSPRSVGSSRGHAFLSYVREDSSQVDALQERLEAAGIPVWRDTSSLWPGENWRDKIRDAISRDALVFIACFSTHSTARQQSYQNEELLLAIDQLRMHQPDDPWLIPVRLDECPVPDFDLGVGRTLASIHQADLFGPNRELEAQRLVEAVQHLLR